jgi:ElaB/YqjD/DUF883 family membrane-anchored ribosome-binding protein
MITEKINSVDKKIKEGEDRIYDSVDAARRHGKELAKEAVSRAEDGLDVVQETIEKSWDRAKKLGSEAQDMIEDYGKKGLKTAQKYAEKNPIRVAVCALVVGAVIGGLLFSGSRES